MIAGLFVTGTDTGVGKTRISAAILRRLVRDGHRVAAMKPVATSAEVDQEGKLLADDTKVLGRALGRACDLAWITPWVFPGDLAPCVAARRVGHSLTHAEVLDATFGHLERWRESSDVVIVEGVGGLLCPLADDSTVLDLAVALDFPLVIVARRGLGTLNHTLMTVEIAHRHGLRLAGVILNGAEPTTNPEAEATNLAELSRRLDGVAVLADLPHSQDPDSADDPTQEVNWSEMVRPPRLMRRDFPTNHHAH